MFQVFDEVRAYINDVLVITKENYDNHLVSLERVLQRLAEAGLKVNADKSFFRRTEIEYLGFWVSKQGIQPLSKKVQAIKEMVAPKKIKDVRRFVGMVNYYRDMWHKRAHTLTPLTKICSTKSKFTWTATEQKAFEDMKRIVGRDVLLSYPDFSKEFIIHTDASKYQLGAVISQGGKPIAFYFQKLNKSQCNYMTTEKELLSIVETLKEFHTILLGQHIKVYTDHKNRTYTNFNTERVPRWCLLLDEFVPEIIYIKSSENNVKIH